MAFRQMIVTLLFGLGSSYLLADIVDGQNYYFRIINRTFDDQGLNITVNNGERIKRNNLPSVNLAAGNDTGWQEVLTERHIRQRISDFTLSIKATSAAFCVAEEVRMSNARDNTRPPQSQTRQCGTQRYIVTVCQCGHLQSAVQYYDIVVDDPLFSASWLRSNRYTRTTAEICNGQAAKCESPRRPPY